jgi:hypothetical protein
MLSVKDLLVEELSKVEKPRSPIPVHASDLTRQSPTFCPRQVVLMKVLGVKDPPQVVAHAMRVTWDEGRDKQWRVNNVYLRDQMVGYWHCVKCGAESTWGKVPHGEVGPCIKERAHHKWEYAETLMRHRAGFIGSFDGVVEFAPARRRILEVKIIKSENVKKSSTPDFRSLVAPLAEHRIRTKLYLKLAAEGHPKLAIDTTAAHILYICRGHGLSDGKGGISPFKEFVVERDDSEIEIYLQMASAVVKSLETNSYPEGVCTSALSERAESCSVCKQCFSGKYPASIKWK